MGGKRRDYDLAGAEGMTLDEISERLGISKQRVWQTLQQAYRKLKRNPRAIRLLRDAATLAEERRHRNRTWTDEEAE